MPIDRTDRYAAVIENMSARFAELWRERLMSELQAIQQIGSGSFDQPQPYESPIELLFAGGLTYCFHAEAASRREIPRGDWYPRVLTAPSIDKIRSVLSDGGDIRAWAQVPVGTFRADFLLGEPGYKNTGPVLVAVECDGHEFHEKTKEQAARDKERGNFFEGQNIPILRYSGSTIWQDPISAAADALTKLEHIAQRRLYAPGVNPLSPIDARSWKGQ